jgi:hypothetical protein
MVHADHQGDCGLDSRLPRTFTMRAGRDNTFSVLTHTSRTWAVLRFDEAGQTLHRFRIVNALGEETMKPRLTLAVRFCSERHNRTQPAKKPGQQEGVFSRIKFFPIRSAR